MKTVSAILTSKGQLTLPKTIREVLDLNEGDKINFILDSDLQVRIEKANNKRSALFNLLMLLMKEEKVIVVKGPAGSGKTTFVADFITQHFHNQKIAIIEEEKLLSKELITRFEASENILFNEPGNINIDSLFRDDIQLIVVEEAQVSKHKQLIDTAWNLGIPTILVLQDYIEGNIKIDHISIKLSKFEVNRMDKINVNGDIMPLYIN